MSRLTSDLHGDATVLRVSIHSATGAVLRERYDFKTAPLFIIFDAEGAITWRGQAVPSRAQVMGE